MAVKGLKVNSLNMSDDVPGLVLINTTSFSAVASQSINDVFSSTYSNYKIITKGTCNSTTGSGALTLRLRVGGSDNTSANYGTARHAYANGVNEASGANTATAFTLNSSNTATDFLINADILGPEQTQKTRINSQSLLIQAGLIIGGSSSGLMTVTTSYTGFTFAIATGSMTGEISVYGYNK
jgi:hypothetical protein